MTDQPTTTATEDVAITVESSLAGSDFGALVDAAVDAHHAALDPIEEGRFLLLRHPVGWTITQVDRHTLADAPPFIDASLNVASVSSFIGYFETHKDETSTLWLQSAPSDSALGEVYRAATGVLDDHHPGYAPARRSHRVHLILYPTDGAARWAAAFGKRLSQADLVDLAVDGIGEIASPPGADLRDLVRDLSVARSSTAKSVLASSGGYTVEFSENVALAAGPGNAISIPDAIKLILVPWRNVDIAFALDTRLKPSVGPDGNVTFTITPIGLGDELSRAVAKVGALIAEGTGLVPYDTAR